MYSKAAWIAVVLLASGATHSVAQELSEEYLQSVSDTMQEHCTHVSQKDECWAFIDEIRNDPKHQNQSTQAFISQWIVPISNIDSKLLDVAYDIADELSEEYPENCEYLEMRAFMRYHQDPVAGLWEAKENNLLSSLSVMLKDYLKTESIQSDIKAFAVSGFEQRIERGDSISLVLSAARLAKESIQEFGDDAEVEAFITSARELIPWDEWRNGEWAQVASLTEFSSESAVQILVTYCGRMMIELDDGAFCDDATNLINGHATEELLTSHLLNSFAARLKKSVENLQPSKAGNSLKVLDRFTGNYYQSENFVWSRCGGNSYENPKFNWVLLDTKPRNRGDLLSLKKDSLTAEEYLAEGEELDHEVWFSRNGDLRVCRFQSNEVCSQSTRIVHFTYEGEWELRDRRTVRCVR